MLVTERDIAGTIGGGQLEWRAVEAARELLAEGGATRRLNLPLGPALQQCCGGYVAVTLEAVTRAVRERLADEIAESRARLPLVALYGAGHVGRAVVTALAPLPCRVLWVDSRADAFPDLLPANAEAQHAAEPAVVAATLPPGTFHLVMTHSHPLDLDIVEAVLRARRLRLARPDRLRHQAAPLREPAPRPRRPVRAPRPPRLPDRHPRHRRQGAGGHRGLGRGPAFASL